MKVVAQKQTKIILVISLILLLLIGLVVIFKDRIILFSKIKSFGKLDKYSHLIDDCEVEKKKGEIVLHCKGVLKSKKRTIEEECIKVEILTNDDTDLREEDLCIDIGGLDWEDPYGDSTAYIPVNIDLIYEKNNIFTCSLKLIELSVINDDELKLLFDKNPKLLNLKKKILTKFAGEIYKNNYRLLEMPLIGEESINRTSFYDAKLKSISVLDSKNELTFEITIKQKKYDVVLYSTKLFYEDNTTKAVTFLTIDDFAELKVGLSYLVITRSASHILSNKIDDYCLSIEEKLPIKRTIINNDFFQTHYLDFVL